ncbi:MAG: hypothetical protein M3Q71_05665 [Chloroflexota bacterium]|nr:hypothetical protein [Chloroflexota bacterium]
MPVYPNRITDFMRTVKTAAGRASVAVTVRKHAGDVQVASTTTDAAGRFTTEFPAGSPGPVYYRTTDGGDTREHSGRSTGQIGTYFASSLPNMFQVFGDGFLAGVGGGCAVTAPGTGMTVSVASGVVLALGHPYPQTGTQALTIAAADATNPRIDLVVVRLFPPGTAEEGRIELAVKVGTPATSPVAPSVQQDATLHEVALAEVRVNAAATSIAATNVTDRRRLASLANGSVSGDTLTNPLTFGGTNDSNRVLVEQADGTDVLSVSTITKSLRLPNGASLRLFTDAYTTGVFILPGTIDPEGAVPALQGSLYLRTNGTIYRKASGTGTTGWVALPLSAGVTSVTDTAGINLTLTGGDLSAAPIFGTAAGTVAEGNHAHAHAALTGIDTDAAVTAIHHTLGTGANQAAAGNHTHPAPVSKPTVFISAFRSGTTVNSTTSTTGVDVLTANPTLLDGVTYDVFAIGALRVAPSSGNRGEVALAVNGTVFAFIGHGDPNGEEVWNAAAVAGIAGTGVAIPTSLQARCSAGSVDYSYGRMLTVAIPRS